MKSPISTTRAIVTAIFATVLAVVATVVSGSSAGLADGSAGLADGSARLADGSARLARGAVAQGVSLKVSMDVEGTTRLAKLRSNIELAKGRFDGQISEATGEDPEELDLRGDIKLPPSDGYFVAFGFMPSTATTVFKPAGPARGVARLDLVNTSSDIDMTVRLFITLRNVKQDGISLAVGSRCTTVRPAAIRLKGKVNLDTGAVSVIKSRYEIPPFGGCGTAEDLDPLLTGLVSGPDNLLTSRLTVRCIACPEEQ